MKEKVDAMEVGLVPGWAIPDPIGASLDALSDHLRAERWFVAFRGPRGWETHRTEASHKDDLLLQIAEAVAASEGSFLYATPELGHAGLRLGTSGVAELLAVVAGDPQEATVVFFENPNRVLAEELVEGGMGETLPRMLRSMRPMFANIARLADLRVLGAWLPTLGQMANGDLEEGDCLRVLGELVGCNSLIALRSEHDHLDTAWANSDPTGWRTGAGRLRNAPALRSEDLGSKQAGTVAKLLGVNDEGDWTVGHAHGGTVLAVSGGRGDAENLDVLASLFDAALVRGRDTSATRNNAMLTERARIAGVIHEGITQVLTNVAIQMEVLDQVMNDPAAARKMVQAMRAAVLEALDSLRGAILELTPNAPEWTDLAGGLERFVGDFAAQWGLELGYKVAGRARDIDPDILALVFAFVQECLSNVRKHAGTDAAEVEVTFGDDTVGVTVTDSGKGFDPADGAEEGFRQHQGLQIIRSRVRLAGGRLVIDSTPGSGTKTLLEVTA